MISTDGKTPDMRRVELEHGKGPHPDIREMLSQRLQQGHGYNRIGREFQVSGMTIANWVLHFKLRPAAPERELVGAGR